MDASGGGVIVADRWQAQYAFWAGLLDVPVYEENSVPDADTVSFPYLTYQAVMGGFDTDTSVSASIWTRSTSWAQADTLANGAFAAIENGGKSVPYDGGMIWFTAGEPFAQSMGDPDDNSVKRKLLNVMAHFC